MAGSLYRIKLYGQSGDDPETFAQSLAALLGIGPSEASALLEQTPAVLRENLTREEAEKLRDIIAAMKGLCLVEPMDSRGESVAASFPPRPRAAAEVSAFGLSPRTMTWMAVGGALLIVFFVAALVMTPKAPVGEKAPTSGLRAKQLPAPAPASKTMPDEAVVQQDMQDLERQMSAIEEEIPDLKKELMQVYRAQQAASSGPNRNPRLAKENFLKSFEIKDEIRVKKHRLRVLRSRLNSLKMKRGVKAPSATE